jgi:uncharacterized protein (DUF983 family)
MLEEKKEPLVGSMLAMKCPKCRDGEMFETGAFSFKKPFDMHLNCPKCGQKFFPTPGFYYGAMFISYIMTGWFSVILMLSLHWWAGLSFNMAFLVLLVFIAALFVWFFRIARVLWIYFNVKYDPAAVGNAPTKPNV